MTREEALEWFKDRKKMNLDDKCQQAEDMAIKALEQEQKTGHWITHGKGDGYKKWHCSNCNMLVRNSQKPWYKFCPNCGAKMIEPHESDLGDYPDAIHNQFDNMTGSMNL